MLSCIYNGKPFTTKEKGYTTEEKYSLGRQKQLLCPVCKTPVFFCEDGEKIAHFTHYKVGECSIVNYRAYDFSSTEKHDNVVEKFVDWVKVQFPEADVYPDYFINNELFTDIYFELVNVKIAIEIQFKTCSNPDFIERRELYKKLNVKDVWFFIRENKDFTIGSPYQRTYYRGNRRELYFYQIEEAVCKVYKGFAGERWEQVGKDTLYNAVFAEVPLEHIKIRNNGSIIIPELYNKYLQKLKRKREKNKRWMQLQKSYREQQNKERDNQKTNTTKSNTTFYQDSSKFDRVLNSSIIQDNSQTKGQYNDTHGSKPQKNIYKASVGRVKQYETVIQDKAYLQEYREYNLKKENGKEYLDITIYYHEKEYKVKYLIINNTGTDNEMFLTCRKEHEPENIRYSITINPFLNSMKKVKIQRYELS